MVLATPGREVEPVLQFLRDPLGPTVAKINLGSISKNFRIFKDLAPKSMVCAVVKADAYGHGMGMVARRLESDGCEVFAVGTVAEALNLRREGIDAPVLLLQGADPAYFDALVSERLAPIISSIEMLEVFGLKAKVRGVSLPFHLKFDTGMGRLGLLPCETGSAVDLLRRFPLLQLEGVATHFARAGESVEFTENQLSLFDEVLGTLRCCGVDPGVVHSANTAACLAEPRSHYDMVRIGLGLFGAAPEEDLPGAGLLSPALLWITQIQHVRDVPSGTLVSYGSTFEAKRRSRLAVVPVGYADGYCRAMGNKGFALVGGRRAPIVGRVCMDMTILDVTDIPSPSRGDEVVLLGGQGSESIRAEEMAAWLRTIPYEILSRIGPRVPRIYLD